MIDDREIKASLVAFGAHLRTARLRRGLTQAGVAAMAGVSLRTLQKLERGDSGIALKTAAAVMRVLGFGLPFKALCAPEADETGRLLDAARVPKRGRRRPVQDPGLGDGAEGEDDAEDGEDASCGMPRPSM